MGGGKSKSSTDQSATNLSADGLVTGQVINVSSKGASTFSYIEEFPESVAEVMTQLINLSEKSIERAFGAGERAVETSVNAAQQASQPDLSLVKSSMKYLPVLVFGLVAVVGVIVWKK